MVLTQQLPQAALAYSRTQRREINAAVAAVARQWRRVSPLDIDGSWARVAPIIFAVLTTAQGRVAAGAQEYVPNVLEDTGQNASVQPVANPTFAPLVGVANDGRSLSSLLNEATIGAKVLIGGGATPGQALAARGSWLSMVTGTLLSDTARQTESLGMGVRQVGGYVRMLAPPSCSRCVILAGKWFRKNQGFQRHPHCDCRHIPMSEGLAGDYTLSPEDYFNSLSEAQQNATFGKAGAEAIRSGADIGQVVNARRGMQYAGSSLTRTRGVWVRKPDGSVVFEDRVVNVNRRTVSTSSVAGRDVLVTAEGITRRGQAYRDLALPGGQGDQVRVVNGVQQRVRSASRPRLMPETIAQIADNQDDYLRLLRANGYLP